MFSLDPCILTFNLTFINLNGKLDRIKEILILLSVAKRTKQMSEDCSAPGIVRGSLNCPE